ncbi:MAG: signal peptidase I [Luteitalea sp.]|nr:signal peptidase I [Luteitalea sp.]
MVQSELHPEDERREGDGNSGQPHADAAPAGVFEVVDLEDFSAPPSAQEFDPSTSGPELAPSAAGPEPVPGASAPDLAPSASAQELAPGASRPESAPSAPAPDLAALPALTEAVAQDAGARRTSAAQRFAHVQEELVAWLKTLVSAAVYAILIVTFGFQVARVEGQSMAPTLEDQDRLIVNKLVYRIGEPRRGDIVMLYYPLNPDKSFVKRVIAEEGDSVRIVEGRVYVNDVPLHDEYVPSEYRSHDDWGPEVIPDGYYFVMGDHRNNSSDSRHWGMVPKKYIIGKVQVRWWPVPTARVF